MCRLNRTISRGINKARRFYLLNFRKAYVEKSLRERKGDCLPNCGACCGDGRCEHLDKNMRCRIYKDRRCHDPFPIDEKEIRLFGVEKECGYYWGQKSSRKRSKSSLSKPRKTKITGK